MKLFHSSKIYFLFVLANVLFVSVSLATPANSGLLFYAPFEKDATPAISNGSAEIPYNRSVTFAQVKVGNAASVAAGKSQLIYDGPGNVYSKAGTASFFWRADENLTGKPVILLDLSSLERTDYARFLQLSYDGSKLSLYFSGGNLGGRTLISKDISIAAGQWNHFALCWDQSRGVAVYMNGAEVISFTSPWVYDGAIAAIGLGLRTNPGFRPDLTSFSASFNELRVYDRWLDSTSLQTLAKGQAPQLAALNVKPLLDFRRRIYAWNNAEGNDLPQLQVGVNSGLSLRQIAIDTAKDVKATDWTVFNGTRASSWPSSGGYRNSGESLGILLQNEQPFDVMQIYGSGHVALQNTDDQKVLFDGELKIPDDNSDADLAPAGMAILPGMQTPTFRSHVFASPIVARHLDLKRVPVTDKDGEENRSGGVYQMGLFKKSNYPNVIPASWQHLALRPATAQDEALPALLGIRQAFYSFDQQTLMATPTPIASKSTFAAMQTMHIVGPAHQTEQGLGAVALELKLESGVPGIMRVQIADPLNPTRFMTEADVKLTGNAGTMRLLFDHRDVVLPAGVRPVISLTFSEDTLIDLSNSTISYQWETVQQALPEFFHDEFARAKDIYSDISEGRSWYAWKTLRSYGTLHHILATLRTLEPQNPEIESYWFWTTPGLQNPIVKLPPVPEGIPAWAVYLDASIDELKKVPYWWIDNRENKYGEYGATDGINDDTDLAADWVAMSFMRGPDQKLINSYKKIADNGWYLTMRQTGMGHYTDALHTYEDGMNANSQIAVLDYGNPIYIERLMATARHYDELLSKNVAGHLHFHDDYYGWYNTRNPATGKLILHPLKINENGTDQPSNASALQPAMLLGWYNNNQYSIDTLQQWTDAMLSHMIADADGKKIFGGVSVDFKTDKSSAPRMGVNYGYGFMSGLNALWDLTGDSRYLDAMKVAIDSEITRYNFPRGSSEVFDRYFQATSDPSFKDKIIAAANDPKLWTNSLHDDNYYQMISIYEAWQYTGDLKYIEDGTKLTLNDTTWELPMLTTAEASTDRVWTPQVLINRVALGGPAMKRNQDYPVLGASWENATGRVAPFVKSYDKTSLDTWVQNMEDHPVTVTMRLWSLDHGQYDISQGIDANQDGAFDGQPQQSSAELARYGAVKITIPARALWLVKIKQTKQLDDIRKRADLAITADDATYDPTTKKLTLVIHNIGAKASGDFKMRVTDGTKVLLDKTISSLNAPIDLIPKTTTISLIVEPNASIRVQLDPENALSEITEVNNEITVTSANLPSQ